MVFLDFALVGLIGGLLAGGSFAALAETPIRGKGYAFAAIALQIAAFPSNVLPWGTSTTVASVLWILSDALLIVMLFQNRRLPGLFVVAAGLASNLIAILAERRADAGFSRAPSEPRASTTDSTTTASGSCTHTLGCSSTAGRCRSGSRSATSTRSATS